MTQKYKLIMADVTNEAYSKMTANVATTIAAAFGYPRARVTPIRGEVLVFNPNTHTVSLLQRANSLVRNSETLVAYSPDTFIALLENPEVNCKNIVSVDGIHDATVFEDTITFRSKKSKLIGTVTVPKDFVYKVLGNERKGIPIVRFMYPEQGKTWSSVTRLVHLIRYDTESGDLIGMEYARAGVEHPKPIFKKYATQKVSELCLTSFIQE